MSDKDKFEELELENKKCHHHNDTCHHIDDSCHHHDDTCHHHHDECSCDDDCGDECDCGCEHEEDIIYVTFDDEGDEEVPCVVLDIFECEGREYIAISPKSEVDSEEAAEVYFYRYSDDGEEVHLDDVETDEEWNAIADVFDNNFFQLTESEEE